MAVARLSIRGVTLRTCGYGGSWFLGWGCLLRLCYGLCSGVDIRAMCWHNEGMSYTATTTQTFALLIEGQEVFRRAYVPRPGLLIPPAFSRAAQAYLSGALDEAGPRMGFAEPYVSVDFCVTMGGAEILRSLARRPFIGPVAPATAAALDV